MKVMTAMYTIRRGGAYDRFIMMLEALLERGCEVHCLSLTPVQVQNPSFYNHILSYPFKNKESSIAKLTVLFFFPLWSIWVGWRKKIDLTVAFGSLYAFILMFSKYLLQKPMVTFIRGNSSFGLSMQNSRGFLIYLNRMIDQFGLLFSDKIVTNNTATRVEILEFLKKKKNITVEVLHNNISPIHTSKPEEAFQTKAKYEVPIDVKMLVTAGVINRGKNLGILIKCLPKVGVGNLYLLIAGDGSTKADFRYKKELKELAQSLKLNSQVIFTGWIEKEELRKVLSASDLFIMPSAKEGMPNVILEALAVGLPVIGSYIPGIRDILQYEELMFDPSDEEVLSKKIRGILSDFSYLRKIKSLCEERKNAFVFDWKEKVFQVVTNAIPAPTAK